MKSQIIKKRYNSQLNSNELDFNCTTKSPCIRVHKATNPHKLEDLSKLFSHALKECIFLHIANCIMYLHRSIIWGSTI